MIYPLNPGNSDNKFCVPAAISLVSGITVEQSVKLLKEELGEQAVTGIFMGTMLKVLKGLGFSPRPISIKKWKELGENRAIIFIPGHVMVYYDGKYYDNHFPLGIPVKQRVVKIEAIYGLF